MDFDRVASQLAADAVMLAPFVDEMPPAEGASVVVERLRSTVPVMFERMNFVFDRWYDVSGTDTLIGEYHSDSPLKGREGRYQNSYISVFEFDSDKIVLFKEYFNPVRMSVLFT
ncbi:nuclear transport factor 2 family protein [Mycolicibacterium pulveris]|uniref:nuclear transport factor 2 family protein n=1 Tax=Mycolicibacterium pulveris TaxID=36813 RepID=UPI003CFAD2B9